MIGGRGLWRKITHQTFIGASVLLLCCNIVITGMTGFELTTIQRQYAVFEQIRDATKALLIGLLNAETGVRGYIITGNDIYLTPYHAGLLAISDQTRDLRLLPLDASQRNDVDQLTSRLDAQMQILTNLIDAQRTSGQSAAGVRLGNGEEKIGLDTLRAYIDHTIDYVSSSMLILQRTSKIYQEIETYCVIFAAFWLYMVIFITARRAE